MSQVLIAIVDDDEKVREATQSLLRSLGYLVSAFGSAEEFLKSDQLHKTSCLITDVQMPRVSGLDLQDRLLAQGQLIPIIFITGYPNETVRTRAMKAGAFGFLIKPYSAQHLMDCLDTALKASLPTARFGTASQPGVSGRLN